MKNLILVIIFIAFNFITQATVRVVNNVNNSGSGSLRAAINAANSGDTVRFNPSLISSGSDSIVLTSEIAFNKSLSIIGLYTATDTLFLSGGGTSRAFVVDTATYLSLDSMVFINNYGTFFNRGAAIYMNDCDSLMVRNSHFERNIGDYGSSVYFASDSTGSHLVIYNSSFLNNQATKTGGVINYSGEYMDITNSNFINNTSASFGGVLYCLDVLRINIDSSSFEGNSSISSGGGLYMGSNGIISQAVSISNSIFNNNTSNSSGGAVRFYNIDNLSITNCKFNNNSAGVSTIGGDGDGGAISYWASHYQMDIEILNCEFNNNISHRYGGAVSLSPYGTVTDTMSLTIDKSSFYGNTCSTLSTYQNQGGGLYVGGTGFQDINMSNTSIVNNSAQNNLPEGGGAYFRSYNGMSFSGDNLFFNLNSSTNGGGGLFIESLNGDGNVSILNSDFTNNNGGNSNGGGLSVDVNQGNLSFLLKNSLVYNNSITAGNGGGVYVFGYPSNITLNSVRVRNNSASLGNGGGVYFNSYTTSQIVNSTIKNNNALLGGGVGCIGPLNSSLSITSSTLNDNTSTKGGAIYCESSNHTVSINSSTIVGNSAVVGGGIFSKSGYPIVDITNSTFAENRADTASSVYSFSSFISSYINVKGNIFSDSAGTNFENNGTTTITSTGHNIFTESIISGSHSSDLMGKDSTVINLGALGSNGGNTFTMMPISPSVAINSGDANDSTDAQNIPIVGVREIGAAEICFATYATDTLVACGSYTWIDGATYMNSDSTATFTMVNAAGCDSVIALNLTIHPIISTIDTVVACVSYTWIDSITYTISNTTATDTLTSIWGCDSIVSLNLTIMPLETRIDTITSCISYTWIDGGTYYSNNNSATFTVGAAIGCDTVVTLNLTIYQPNTSTDVLTVCDSLVWIDGNTYTSNNNTAQFTATNRHGCDSVVTLDLTVHNSVNTTDYVSACNSYTWLNGVTYTTGNTTAIDTLQTINGCDSIVSLNLTMNYSTTAIDTHVVCDSLVWIDGNTYTVSNTQATHTLIGASANGCDSVVTLDLTVNANSSRYIITACDSLVWIDGVTYTSDNNTATQTFTNVLGCDSVVNLELTILNSSHVTHTVLACGSYLWNGITYTSSNSTATQTFTNSVGCDSIVTLDLTIFQPNTGTEIVNACDSYTWNGITYTTSNNTALDTLVNIHGCDSIVTLNLTIFYSTTGIETVTVCDSYMWNGITYTADNNTALDTLVNANGCDSIVTLNLTVNANSSRDIITVCDSLTWIDGITYTVDNNTATQTFTNVLGCDSVVNLELTVLNSSHVTHTVSACVSYLWNGITYTSSNSTATQTFTNSDGCDSIVTLDLTIFQPNTGTHIVTACDSYTWNGITYSSNNTTALDTLVNINGCDSIVTLNLTIINSTTGVETVTVCDSYTWNGITYTVDNNTALDTLVNANGCDSIVTLNLTILNSSTRIDTITSCNSITWLDGNTYVASNNSATYTLANSVGCDSIIVLNFTLLSATSATDVISECTPLTWIDGNVYNQSISGPKFTIPNTAGCDSVITLDFTLLEVDTTVIRNYLTLTAQATNATFQWIDCDADTIITGATQADFTVTQSGNYSVEISQNGCVDTTGCFAFTNVSVVDVRISSNLKVYPNPVHDQVNVKIIDWPTNEVTIVVRDMSGKKVFTKNITPISNTEIITVNCAKWAKGTYFIEVIDGDKRVTEKIIIQ